jgi:CubicO group peptidase (beta-lactamase class C family)
VDTKRLALGSLAVGAGLALTRRLFATNGSAGAARNGASYDSIDAYIEQQMHRLKIPGLSLAIVECDKIVHRRGFGRARPGGEAPTPLTPFVLGSTTKSITALAVMQLVEAGKVDLDAPIKRYLPWFRVADPEASTLMTVRHLLNQTSGLPMLAGMTALVDLDNDPGAAERQARALSNLKLTRAVGAAFEYCNLNYNLLGLVVEAASGESYPAYIQRHIFAPLGMNHSHSSLAAAKRDGLAVGHRYWFAHPIAIRDLPLPRGSLPSGQLISCSENMAHYLIAHLNGGRFREAQLLSNAGIDELHHGVAEQQVMGQSVAAYGMGWFVSIVGGTKVVSHGGNVPDFSSYMALLPEQKKGVVLLLNADHYGLPFILMEVGDGVAALLAGQQAPPIRLGFLPWVMRALPLIPLLQIAGVFATLRLVRRWRRNRATRPGHGRLWGAHVLLPLIPNLSLVAVLAYLRSGGLLRYLRLYNPDVSWIARISGSFAGIWSVIRTGLVLCALGGSSSPAASMQRPSDRRNAPSQLT